MFKWHPELLNDYGFDELKLTGKLERNTAYLLNTATMPGELYLEYVFVANPDYIIWYGSQEELEEHER